LKFEMEYNPLDENETYSADIEKTRFTFVLGSHTLF